MKPLLAATLDSPSELQLPTLASPKLDGIRCELIESIRTANLRMAYSRTLKPIPNIHIRKTLTSSQLPLGLDGELIVGSNFQQTTSAVMSAAGEPEFYYHVFDYIGDGINLPFIERYKKLQLIVAKYPYPWLKLVEHKTIETLKDLDEYEQQTLAAGYEGVMLRSPTGRYKYGRSTKKQGILFKLKRFTDDDAQVIGFAELEHNCNTQTRDNLGLAERSSNQALMIPGNTLGSLIVRWKDQTFNVGTGFTQAQRQEIWDNRSNYLHKWCTFKYQNHGIKVAPRAPVFLRWREDHDL